MVEVVDIVAEVLFVPVDVEPLPPAPSVASSQVVGIQVVLDAGRK